MVSDKPEAVSVPDEPTHDSKEEEAESPLQDSYSETQEANSLGHCRRATPAVTGGLHPTGSEPTKHDHRPVPVKRLGGSDKKETTYPTSQVSFSS